MSLPVSELTPGVQARRGGGGVAAAVVALVLAIAAGVAAGLIWRLVAPHVAIIRVEQGFVYADAEPEQAVAADGWFALLGLAAGLLVAILAWVVLRRHRGMLVLLGLVVGSLAGAWIGWRIGIKIEDDHFRALARTAAVGAHLDAPLSLHMSSVSEDESWRINGVLVVQALAAAALYTIMAGFSADADLRPGRMPQPDPALAGTGLGGTELGSGTWVGAWSPHPAPAGSEPAAPSVSQPAAPSVSQPAAPSVSQPGSGEWPGLSSGPGVPAGPTG